MHLQIEPYRVGEKIRELLQDILFATGYEQLGKNGINYYNFP